MRWSSAISEERDLGAALDAAVADLRTRHAAAPVDLAVAFVSHHFSSFYERFPEELAQRLDAGVMVGCSAGGVIGNGREVEQRPAIALTVAHLPGVRVTPLVQDGEDLPDADAPPSAWHAALGCPPDPTPHFVLLADPFSMPVEPWLAGMDYAYPRSTKVGGLASGATRPGDNALFAGSRVRRAGAVGIALEGNVAIDTVVAQGCRPIGEALPVTRCQDNVLVELDGKPPLHVLQELFPSLPEADRRLLPHSLFLGVVMDELAEEHRAGDFLIRNLIGIDPERGIMAVGEQLRRGQTVQFHLRDARTSADDLEQLLRRFATAAPSSQAHGALLFSCLGRGVHLYGHPDHDTDTFRRHFGDVPLGGFFCNGEIGPVGGATRLHGYTSSFGIFRPGTA